MNYDFESQFREESTAFFYANQSQASTNDVAANEQTDSLLSSVNTSKVQDSPLSGTLSGSSMNKIVLKENHFAPKEETKQSSENSQTNSPSSDSKNRRENNKLNEMFILRSLKVSIMRRNFKKDHSKSKEVKS